MLIKEILCCVALVCVAMFLPVSAALADNSVAAFLGIIPGMVVLVTGSELLADYSIKHWKDK